jgi:hypothetical protein
VLHDRRRVEIYGERDIRDDQPLVRRYGRQIKAAEVGSALLLLSLDASIFALVFLFAVGWVVVCEPFCPLLGKIATCV